MRIPAQLSPTTAEHLRLPSGREVDLPKATPRFAEWKGEFPWSTYGGKPILDLRGKPLYAEFVIVRLLEAEGWSGVWVNHVHRGPFPTRWTPSPVKILPPRNLLDLLDRIYARSGKRSGAFDVLAWAGESVLFAEAKHGGKDALRPSQKAWIEAALDEGVPLRSLLVVEWGFSGMEVAVGCRGAAGAADERSVAGTGSGIQSPHDGMPGAAAGGGAPPGTRPPEDSVTINGGKAVTSTRRVKLTLRAADPSPASGAIEVRIKNGGGYPWTEWRTFANEVDWKLSEGEGQKVVYVQFRDRAGNKSEPAKATVNLRQRVGAGDRLGKAEGDTRTTGRTAGAPSPEPRVTDSTESSPLASEVEMRPSSEDLDVFFDRYDPDAHGKFLRWREGNRRGYVISRRSASEATLHRADCGHFEHGDKSASLTRTMKVCSGSKRVLEGWARKNIGAGSKGAEAACSAERTGSEDE